MNHPIMDKLGVPEARPTDRHSNGLSPTLNTDSVILTGVMDLNDLRAVAMLDIDNAFLHVENDEYVLMLLCAKLK